jgi:hypothetical protein
MAYTPELTLKSSAVLRRIAWALRKPMTKALEEIMEFMAKKLCSEKVCMHCRDKRCEPCPFNKNQ